MNASTGLTLNSPLLAVFSMMVLIQWSLSAASKVCEGPLALFLIVLGSIIQYYINTGMKICILNFLKIFPLSDLKMI